jgi:hypothetical protein
MFIYVLKNIKYIIIIFLDFFEVFFLVYLSIITLFFQIKYILDLL